MVEVGGVRSEGGGRAEAAKELEAEHRDRGAEEGLPQVRHRELRGTDLDSEEHTSDGRAECAGDADGDGCRQELVPERPVRRQLRVRQALGDAAGDVHEWSFLAEAEACPQHADHTEALADVGPEAEHVGQREACHDGLHLRDATASGRGADVLEDAQREAGEEHAHEDPEPVAAAATQLD